MSPKHGQQMPGRQQWADHLQQLIDSVLVDVPFDKGIPTQEMFIDQFRDEFGNRRATDRPFLAYLLRVDMNPVHPRKSDRDIALDERLWWTIQSGQIQTDLVQTWIADSGPLVVGSNEMAIEYRTMVELCALHGLWHIATREKSQKLLDRCLEAASWHTQELQPDNAINRPWGVHVFIELALRSQQEEIAHLAHLHAQTLVHNASVSLGKPDLLSALILNDSAAHLLSDPV
jgi:hypothetical protein